MTPDREKLKEFIYSRDIFGSPYRFVDPRATRSPRSHPYSYDAHFLKGGHADIKDASSYYTDRISLWKDGEEFSKAREAAGLPDHGNMWRTASLEKLTAFHNALFGKTDRVVAVAECCNVSNGYPIWIVWTKAAPDA